MQACQVSYNALFGEHSTLTLVTSPNAVLFPRDLAKLRAPQPRKVSCILLFRVVGGTVNIHCPLQEKPFQLRANPRSRLNGAMPAKYFGFSFFIYHRT